MIKQIVWLFHCLSIANESRFRNTKIQNKTNSHNVILKTWIHSYPWQIKSEQYAASLNGIRKKLEICLIFFFLFFFIHLSTKFEIFSMFLIDFVYFLMKNLQSKSHDSLSMNVIYIMYKVCYCVDVTSYQEHVDLNNDLNVRCFYHSIKGRIFYLSWKINKK